MQNVALVFWGSGFFQWLFLVPIKGGIGGIVHPPIGSIYHLYTTHSPCLLGGYMLPIPPFMGTRNNHWFFGQILLGWGMMCVCVCLYIYICVCMLYHIFRIYTRCAPTRYKWSSGAPINGRKWIGNWGYFTLLIGVITPIITGFPGPTL